VCSELKVLLGLLPREVGVDASEVAVLCSFKVDRAAEIQFFDDVAWAEAEVIFDNLL
jgi:hypothetical protein